MNPVTGLEISARSTGLKFKKQNQNGWNIACFVRDCRSFVDSCNFTRILLKWKCIHDINYANIGSRELTLKCNREPHEAKKKSFDLGGNRTHDLRIRSPVILPTELQGRTEKVGHDFRW